MSILFFSPRCKFCLVYFSDGLSFITTILQTQVEWVIQQPFFRVKPFMLYFSYCQISGLFCCCCCWWWFFFSFFLVLSFKSQDHKKFPKLNKFGTNLYFHKTSAFFQIWKLHKIENKKFEFNQSLFVDSRSQITGI